MAEQHSEKFLLAFDIEMQMRKASQKVGQFERQLQQLSKLPKKFQVAEKKALVDFEKGLRKSTSHVKQLQKSLIQAGKDQTVMGRKARQQAKEWAASFDEVKKASNDLRAVVKKNIEKVSTLEKRIRDSNDAEEKKALQEKLKRAQDRAKSEIALQRKVYSGKRAELNKNLKKSGALTTIKEQQGDAKKKAEEFKGYQEAALKAGKSLEDATSEAVEKMKYGLGDVAVEFTTELMGGVKEAVEALGSKDLKGVGTGLAKGLGKGLMAGMSGMAKWGDKNKDKGGVTGMAAGGIASAMKSMSGLMKSLGPTLSMLAKLGPVLSATAAIVVGLVKVMLDAEAQAKQFNKDILESSGSTDFLAQAGGNADLAYKNLSKTLDDVRDHAFDAEQNMKWGIAAKDHQAVLNALNQEGVTLTALQKDFKNAGDAASSSAAAIQDWTDLTHMSVGFSRAFGVSLQEISTLQAELFTEMGTSLSGIQLQFSRMQKDAAESGIAANKFFNIIRGVSADLALYNTRLEQTTTILKNLGKAMSPKNAQKFLQQMTKGFKDLSEEDRIKQTLIVGADKMRDIVKKDLSRKKGQMYADMASELSKAGVQGVTATDISKASAAEFERYVQQLPKERQAAIREAQSEFKMDQNAIDKGGVVGTAEAASNLSAAASFVAKKAALQRFGGNKKLSEMTGIQGFAARKVAGVSMEEFRGMAKMEAMLDEQRKQMQEAFAAQTKSPEQKAMLDRLAAIGVTDEKMLDKADDADIIAAMQKSDQEALAASQEQTNWAEKQANLTSSISDKMETIIEGIFEFLYVALKDVISDINEFINLVADKFGKARPEKAARDALRAGKTEKNARIVESMQRALASDGPGSAKDKMVGALGPMLAAGMEKANRAQLHDDIGTVLSKGFQQDNARIASVVSNKDTAIDQAKKDKFAAALEKDPNAGAFVAMKAAGFTDEDMKAFLAKSVWGMTEQDLARVAPNLQTVQLGAGSIKNRPPSAQAEAAQKAVAPGTQGAPGAAAAVGAGADRIPPAAAATIANPTTSVGTGNSNDPAKQGEQLIKGNDAIHDALRQQGIKIDKSFLTNTYEKSMKDAMYDAMKDALFEFALYTAKDPMDILNRMGKLGGRSGDMARAFADNPANAAFLGKNADGGHVVGIANGRAVIAAPGEGLASIGKGETILPAKGGRGGDTFQINVNGLGGNDLARFLQQRIGEAIYEYKRREKFS